MRFIGACLMHFVIVALGCYYILVLTIYGPDTSWETADRIAWIVVTEAALWKKAMMFIVVGILSYLSIVWSFRPRSRK